MIYLIHVQKTSGTALRVFFERVFGASRCLWHAPKPLPPNRDNLLAVAAVNPERLSGFEVIGGHVGFGKIPQPILDQAPVFVSCIRDPVARIVSHYQHIRTAPGHGLHGQVVGKTLYDALHSRGFANQSDRIQIEFLAGKKDLGSLRDTLEANKFVVGKQETAHIFFDYLSGAFQLPRFNDARANEAPAGYQAEIEAQPDYDRAVEVIMETNRDEYTFFNSFGDVWSNY